MNWRSWAALVCAALAACQVVTGLSSLELTDADVTSSANEQADAGSDERAGDAGPDQPDAGGGSRCLPPHGMECDLVTQCGCTADQHCQALGAAWKPSCAAPGSLEPGSTCDRPADCPRGQTCDDHVCRAYCRSDADCKAGKCVAAHVSDPKSSGINVCWTKCQVGKQGMCGPGARCRALQPERSSKANYCAAPADPCPTIEDGRCDDSRGTGDCADGTDRRDCDCRPQLPDASCDLILQCGCAKGTACVPVAAMSGATCVPWTGTKQAGEACQRGEDCAAGHLCRFGSCTRLCDSDAQCSGGKCLTVDLAGRGEAEIATCYQTCDRGNPSSCRAGTYCAHFDQRFAAGGDLCIQPLAPCFERDGVCDEPAGSGICAADTDPVDCCKPTLAGGECNLLLQCGCEGKPGTSCFETVLATGARTTVCLPAGATEIDNWCVQGSDCRARAGCIGNVCRRYCAVDGDCQAGGRCVSADRNEPSSPIRACLGPCDPKTNLPCGPNTRCLAGMIDGAAATGCTLVPLTTSCPTQNRRCDEPEGTGLCEQGSDEVDCR